MTKHNKDWIEGYEEGFQKGVISKTVQKCPNCNKLIILKRKITGDKK